MNKQHEEVRRCISELLHKCGDILYYNSFNLKKEMAQKILKDVLYLNDYILREEANGTN